MAELTLGVNIFYSNGDELIRYHELIVSVYFIKIDAFYFATIMIWAELR